jgi:outer membrane protein assembly factor BamE (lipoprotein component of BamABCDE complex)
MSLVWDGQWLLTDTEQVQQQLKQAQDQIRQAVRNLLASGMTPEQVAEVLGLPWDQV